MNATTYPLTLFFDAACPLCRREMQSLRRRDRARRLRFEDVRAPGFVAPAGTTVDAMLVAIHGPDGGRPPRRGRRGHCGSPMPPSDSAGSSRRRRGARCARCRSAPISGSHATASPCPPGSSSRRMADVRAARTAPKSRANFERTIHGHRNLPCLPCLRHRGPDPRHRLPAQYPRPRARPTCATATAVPSSGSAARHCSPSPAACCC